MTVRWWDPGVPVDLLTPGPDPVLDQANRLIAMHRTGAAALLAAAQVPLCDEGTVTDALELTAAAARVEIAKADVDDAVSTANDTARLLYRSCVAKGVIPPAAITRVAKVYGVPAAALGRYPQLAFDPKTPEPVLTDTADRTLFGWVAAASQPELIGKAVETPDERRAAQARQPRDRGRYATYNTDTGAIAAGGEVTETTVDGKPLGQWLADNLAAPLVGTAPEEPSLPKTTKKIKTIRSIKTIQTVSTTPAKGRKAKGRKAKGRIAGVREALGRTAKTRLTEARKNAARITREVPEPFGDYPVMDDPRAVTAPGVIVLPLDEYEHFRNGTGLGERPGERAFQMGALNTYVHFSPTSPVDVAGSQSHTDSIRYVTKQIRDQPDRKGLPEPVVWELDAEEEHELDAAVRAGDRHLRDRLIQKFAAKRLRHKQDELGLDDRDLSVAREIGYVDYYLDADDEETPLLVWRRPVEYGDYTTHRPTTTLAEIVIEDGVGQTDWGTRHGESRNSYDASMTLGIKEDPDPVMFFDRSVDADGEPVNAAIYRVSAKMLEDDEAQAAFHRTQERQVAGYRVRFKKAESGEQRRAAQADQPRDHGRYAVRTDADAAVTETTIDGMPIADWLAHHLAPVETEPVTAPPARKPVKTIRTIRTIRTIPPAVGRAAEGREAAGRVAEGRVAAGRFAQARKGSTPEPDEMALADNTDYHLMSVKMFAAKTGIGKDTMHAALTPEARNWLDSTDTLNDDGVVVELFKRHMKAKRDREGEHWPHVVLDKLYDVSAVDEYGNNIGHEMAIDTAARELHAAFKQDKDLQVTEINLRRVWLDGREHVRVIIRGNARQLPDMALIRRGDIDPAAPMLITWESYRRALNLGWIRGDLRSYWPLKDDRRLPGPQSRETTFLMTNPWVEQWVAHSPDEYLRDS